MKLTDNPYVYVSIHASIYVCVCNYICTCLFVINDYIILQMFYYCKGGLTITTILNDGLPDRLFVGFIFVL